MYTLLCWFRNYSQINRIVGQFDGENPIWLVRWMEGCMFYLIMRVHQKTLTTCIYFFLHVVFIILKNICIHMFMYIYKVPDTVHKAKYHSYNLYIIVFIHIRNLWYNFKLWINTFLYIERMYELDITGARS